LYPFLLERIALRMHLVKDKDALSPLIVAAKAAILRL
jgi:hypothetical protein